MKLTQRGRGALLAAFSEALLASLLLDPLIAALSASLAAALLIDAVAARRRVSRVHSVVARAVEGKSLRVPVGGSGGIEAPPLPSYASLRPRSEWVEVKAANGRLAVLVKPRLFGLHSVELVCSARSPLGLLEASRPSRFQVVSYPRALPLLIAVTELAGGAGGAEGREKGVLAQEGWGQSLEGFEYAGSKEYAPSDKPRRIDWRATARTGKLYVKELKGGGGGLALLFSGEAPGPQVADFVASALLAAALTAYREGLSVSFIRIVGPRIEFLSEVPPRKALTFSLALALEQLKLGYEALEHVVPQPAVAKLAALRKLGLESVVQALEARRLEAVQAAELCEREGFALFVGSLTSGVQSVLDVAYELAKRGVQALFVVHPKPWVDARGVGEELVIRSTHERALQALKSCCKLAYTPEAASRGVEAYALMFRTHHGAR